jgi:uncharacterized protein
VLAATAPGPHRLAMAWRSAVTNGKTDIGQDYIGIIEADVPAGQLRIVSELAVPTRAHGLLAETDGGFLVVDSRPGRWLMRVDADGRVVKRLDMVDDEDDRYTLDGHVYPDLSGQWLYTTETDRATGEGWVGVRDARTLEKVAQWRTHGRDPHQLLVDTDGALLVANGGIPRTAEGKKRDLDQMRSSLVRLHPERGELLGQWRLDDSRLSLRHMAWNNATGTERRLGVALQAEHDDLARRRAAPVLAVWDGQRLSIPSRDARCGGYAGDIAAGPGGGFILSGQRVGRGAMWHPDAPDELFTIAELNELCALTETGAGVLIAAARGLASWHPNRPPALLAWPKVMTPDNHWVVLKQG